MIAEAESQAGSFDCVVDASVGIKLFLVRNSQSGPTRCLIMRRTPRGKTCQVWQT